MKKRLVLLTIAVLVCATTFLSGAFKSEITPLNDKTIATDPSHQDMYGFSTAIYGSTTVVGAPNWSSYYWDRQGCVYVYKRSASGQVTDVQQLVAEYPDNNESFGYSVDIYDDYIAVGNLGRRIVDSESSSAPEGKANDGEYVYGNGHVYIFKKDGDGQWNQVAKLLASDTGNGDYFGCSVAIAPGTKDNAPCMYVLAGASKMRAAYLFRETENDIWVQQQRYVANPRYYYSEFGASVALYNDQVLVGAPGYEGQGQSDVGAVFLYSVFTPYVDSVEMPALSPGDRFGESVSIHEDRFVVGCPGYEPSGYASDYDSGTAFQYDSECHDIMCRFFPNNPKEGERFGTAVSNYNNRVAVGSNYGGLQNSGVLYMFRYQIVNNSNDNDIYEQKKKYLPFDAATDQFFGTAVDIWGHQTTRFVCGAYKDTNTNGSQSGAVYNGAYYHIELIDDIVD
ncbi:MAG: hypothetical protein GY757_26480 [bacterium]|nr:hypothetical protein [bacterium]